MSEAQTEAVVRMQLGQLAALERDEIFKEYNELRGKIVAYETLLGSERNIDAVIKARFQDPADSARTEGGALTHPQLSGLGTVSGRSRARTFRACPRTCDHAAELGLRYVSVRVVWHC